MPTQESLNHDVLDLVDQQERIAVRDDPLDQVKIGGCHCGCIHNLTPSPAGSSLRLASNSRRITQVHAPYGAGLAFASSAFTLAIASSVMSIADKATMTWFLSTMATACFSPVKRRAQARRPAGTPCGPCRGPG